MAIIDPQIENAENLLIPLSAVACLFAAREEASHIRSSMLVRLNFCESIYRESRHRFLPHTSQTVKERLLRASSKFIQLNSEYTRLTAFYRGNHN